tara:strand:+ start:209 stop:451 length:243 start_codon:yes stop_codon:yes gene_type:complete
MWLFFGFSQESNRVEINKIIKKVKRARKILSFLIKCNSFQKVKIPIKEIDIIIIFVTAFPKRKDIGKQKNNIFASLKFIS